MITTSTNILADILSGNSGGDSSSTYINNRTRKDRASESLEAFAMEYFPDIFYIPFNDIHREIFNSLESMILEKRERNNYLARAIPRRSGKSQIVSFLLPLWCIVFKYHMNILIVSETQDQSRNFSLAIKCELEENEEILKDFGKLSSTQVWAADKFLCSNGVYLSCKSMGGRLRGIKHRNHRPSLLILDDCDSEQNNATEEMRKANLSWLHSVLIPCADKRASFCFVGTICHSDSTLENILTKPKYNNWDRKKYRGITKFSDSELWDTWLEMSQDEDNPNATNDAYDFFMKNKDKMLRGVECFWQTDDHYYMDLMILKSQNPSSFAQEYLNECIIEENRIFPEEIINPCLYDGEPPEEIKHYVISLDPSLAKNNKSDYSGLTVIGVATSGKMYVVEAIEKRIRPHELIEVAIFYAIKYREKLFKFAIETTVWQAFFADELKRKATEANLYIDWAEMKPTAGNDKELRIKSLTPKFRQRYLYVRRDMKCLINELLLYPVSPHDDVVDSLTQGVSCICSYLGAGASSFSFTKINTDQLKSNFTNPLASIFRRR